MHGHDPLPEDVQREIAGHLDEPTKRLSRSVSTKWRSAKKWCNDEYIRDAHEFPILAREVKEAYTGESIFMLLWTDDETEYQDAGEMSLELIVLDGHKLTTIILVLLFDDDVDDWMRIETTKTSVDVSGIKEGIDIMFSRISGDTTYWLDPFISRDIVARRLRDCEGTEETKSSLRRFFPWHEYDHSSLDNNYQEVYGMYVLGYAIILGRFDPNEFSVMYDYLDVELGAVFQEVEDMT